MWYVFTNTIYVPANDWLIISHQWDTYGIAHRIGTVYLEYFGYGTGRFACTLYTVWLICYTICICIPTYRLYLGYLLETRRFSTEVEMQILHVPITYFAFITCSFFARGFPYLQMHTVYCIRCTDNYSLYWLPWSSSRKYATAMLELW